MRNFTLLIVFSCFLWTLSAQESISGIINEYTAVIAIGACNNSVLVTNSSDFEIGNQVILIQIKGAEINSNDNADFGKITSLGNAGKYEKAVITAINNNTIEFEKALVNEYTPSGKVQLVSMPVYEDVEVVGELTTLPWNGTIGGILAFESTGTLTISADITVVGLGFRGGISETISPNDCSWLFNQNNYFYDANNWRGAHKGEGIAEFIVGKEAGRGPQANGGGGGNDHNSGGGGGSNAGAGGQGGENDEPSTFGCDGEFPGLGGRDLEVDTSRIFFGGGGGAGHSNNGVGTNGGNGGGIIIIEGNVIQMFKDIDVAGIAGITSGGDGAGGGGSGGTLVLYANDFSQGGTGEIAISGGNGGSINSNNTNRCFGPGGGGSGGRVLTNLNLGTMPSTGGSPGRVLNSAGSCNNSTLNAVGGDNASIIVASGIPEGEENASLSIVEQPISQQACLGTDIVFSTQVIGTDLNYQWQANTGSGFQNISDGAIYNGTTGPNLNVLNLSLTQNGHTFRLVIDNPCSSMVLTEEVMIDIFDVPVITVQPQSISTCLGEVNTFAFNATGLGINYQWQKMESGVWVNLSNDAIFNGVNSSTLSISVDESLSNVTSFQCVLIDDCGVEIISEIVQLNILSSASANLSFASNGLTVDFNNLSQNSNAYQWNFGDTNSSMESNPSHTYALEGTYAVELIAFNNDCGPDTFTTEIVLSLGMLPTASFSATPTSSCAPGTIQFVNNSSSNAESYLWSFPNGDPSTSTLQNPSVNYNSPGSFDVSLIVSNAAGSDMNTVPDYIVINDAPNASFASGVLGATVDFSNLSTNATSYSWSFGDGGMSTEVNPTYVYSAAGNYTVSLTATNECGEMTFMGMIQINSAPVASFQSNLSEGCAPLTIQFTDNSGSTTDTWNWTFLGGNPATSTEQNPIVTYVNAGSYEVSLMVSNPSGSDQASIPNYIVVNDAPNASFASGVLGSIVDFTNLSTNATSYSWSFGDGGISTDTNPTYVYSAAGNYTVILTAMNECGEMTFTEMIEINSAPVADFESNITSGCAPLTIQFTDNSTPMADAWNWTFLGGNPVTSTQQNPIVEYTTAGTYDVALEVANQVGNNAINQTGLITVQDIPSADFSHSINGETVDFTNLSTHAITLTWDFGDGEMSNTPNPSHTYAMPGTYIVDLISENECGTDIFTTTIVIEETIILNASFSSDLIAACAPFVINYEDVSSGDVSSWSWSFPGGTPSTSTEQNPTIYYNDPGLYDVSLEVGNGLTTDEIVMEEYLTLVVPPQADFDYTLEGNALTLINNSENANFYEWSFGNGFANSNEENPFKLFWETGVYTVSLFASNGFCGSIIAEDISIIVTNTHQLNNELSVDLFPNPVNDWLTVKFNTRIEEELVLKIWSSNGQLLQQKILKDQEVFEIDFSAYSNGLYLFQLIGENVNLIERIIKK